MNKNSETLILKGTSINNSDSGPNISFYKATNEIITSSIGYRDNSQQIFEFNADRSAHIWKFNTDANLEIACNVPGHYQLGMISKLIKLDEWSSK